MFETYISWLSDQWSNTDLMVDIFTPLFMVLVVIGMFRIVELLEKVVTMMHRNMFGSSE